MIHGPYQTFTAARIAHPSASILRRVDFGATGRGVLAFDNSYDALFHHTTSGTVFLLKLIQQEPRHTRNPRHYPL